MNSDFRRTCDHLFVADADADVADDIVGGDAVVAAAAATFVVVAVVVETVKDSTSSY